MTNKSKSFALTASMMMFASAVFAADLPVEEYPGGIEDDPTPAPTLSAETSGRDLPVEDYPGSGGGGGTGGGDDTDVTLAAVKQQIAQWLVSMFR